MTSGSSVSGQSLSLPVANQRTVWALAWPIMLSNITVPMLGLVDTAILGHLDAVQPLAAVAIGAQLFTLLLWSFGFLRMGTTSVTANGIGRYGLSSSLGVLQQAIWLALPVSIICVVTALTLTPLLLPLFGDDLTVQRMASEYLHIRFAGIPVTLLQYCLIGWFIGRGETRIPMLMLISANLLNAGLDYLLVWHLDLGTQGIALGTLLADAGALSIALYAAVHRGLSLRLPRPDYSILKGMITINADLFVRTLTLLSVFALFAALGAAQSTEVLAANAVMISLLLLISNALDGFAHAAESLVGRFRGAGLPERLKRVLVLTASNSLLAALFLVLMFVLAGDHLFRLLTDNDAILPRLQDMSLWLWLLPLSGVASYWLDGVMVGAQASAAMRNSMLAAALIIFVPLSALPYLVTLPFLASLPLSVLTAGLTDNTLLWLAFHLFLIGRALFLLPALLRLLKTLPESAAVQESRK